MLALARQKVGNALVQFQQADLFQWQPGQRYELVSFAHWVSLVLRDGSMSFLPLSPVPSYRAALSRWWISMLPCKRIARSACSAKRVQLFVNNAPGWPGGLAAWRGAWQPGATSSGCICSPRRSWSNTAQGADEPPTGRRVGRQEEGLNTF